MVIDVASIGQTATWLRTTVTRVGELARELGITPAARINGIDHFATNDIHRMADRLKGISNAAATASH